PARQSQLPPSGAPSLALLGQILATRSLHRSSHSPTKVLTEQAERAFGKPVEARRGGKSVPTDNSDGLADWNCTESSSAGRSTVTTTKRSEVHFEWPPPGAC